MKHLPTVPRVLQPITPFLHEADTLMDTVLSGQLSESRQHEAQMVAYYCISHALWLGQHFYNPDSESTEFLCVLAEWQERLKPHPAQIQQTSLDQNHICEFLGSVAIICHDQRDDGPLTISGEKPPLEQCCVSTGPATASVEVFENERHAPFVGWSAKHLLPYERGRYSNENGSVREVSLNYMKAKLFR